MNRTSLGLCVFPLVLFSSVALATSTTLTTSESEAWGRCEMPPAGQDEATPGMSESIRPHATNHIPLSIGDPAPAFDIASWVQGDEITGFEDGKVTVLVFWSAWGEMLKLWPSPLSDLNDRVKASGTTIIAVSNEPPEVVRNFLASEGGKWSQRMRFAVASDPDRSTWASYMTAADQEGMPLAFVIGKTGKIEWIGHPLAILGGVIEQVNNGTWDAGAYRQTYHELYPRILGNWLKNHAESDFAEAQNRGDRAELAKILCCMLTADPSILGNWLRNHAQSDVVRVQNRGDSVELAKIVSCMLRADPTIAGIGFSKINELFRPQPVCHVGGARVRADAR